MGETPSGKNGCFMCIVYKRSKKYYEKLTIYKCGKRLSMTIGCIIWMICLKLNCAICNLFEKSSLGFKINVNKFFLIEFFSMD